MDQSVIKRLIDLAVTGDPAERAAIDRAIEVIRKRGQQPEPPSQAEQPRSERPALPEVKPEQEH